MDQAFYQDLAESLDRDGFCIWRGLLPHAAIDRHATAWRAFAPEHQLDLPFGQRSQSADQRHRAGRSAEEFHQQSAEAGALWLHPDLQDFARWRFGAEPFLRLVGTNLLSLGSYLHSDYLATAAPDPWEREFRVWGALEDIDPEAGPMYLLPGTHRSVLASLREEVLAARPDVAEALRAAMRPVTHEQHIAALRPMGEAMNEHLCRRLNELGIQPVTPALRKGDAILFNPGIAHGTTPAVRPERTRMAFVANIGAMGASFYMPRAYWGALHDHRRPGNAVPFEVEHGPHGLCVSNYLDTFEASLARPIAA